MSRFSLITPPSLAKEALPDLAGWAASAGFAAIDAETTWSPVDRDTLVAAGLRPGPMRIRASLADSDPATRDAAAGLARDAIDRAVALGLDTVWTLPRNFRNDASPRANFAAALETLPGVVAHAERAGVRIAIENCPFEGQNPVCTPEAWDALFAAIPSEALGICMDPSHAVWQGIDYLRATREYAPRVYHVHAKDTEIQPEGMYRYGVAGPVIEEALDEDGWPRHGWWRHRLPGLGGVDWVGFLSTLGDVGYAGLVTIEHEDPLWGGDPERVRRGLARSRAFLGDLMP